MVIASIDLMNGKVVQLKNGKEPVLEFTDADALLAEFTVYGETAIIDLDAALGHTLAAANGSTNTGETVNTGTLKRLLRKGNARVGGGIRTVEKAKELISLGAEKIIIGSQAFNTKNVSSNDFRDSSFLNTEFLDALVAAVGKERIIISVDAIEGNIAVRGWTERSGIPLLEGARAVEKYASELLFTCVEREGCMKGADFEQIKALRSSVSCRLTVAGGIASLEEIAALEKIGCDVQLGMALYTKAVSLKDAFIECLNWEKVAAQNAEQSAALIPVIAQSPAGEVLMLGYANREALEKTFAEKKLTFYSRTRQTLWTKGETSGNYLELVRLRADCDRDTVLATVIPRGQVCHTGSWTCFSSESAERSSPERLLRIIAERFANPTPGSYTATLDGERVREKIMEEAEELIEAEDKADVVWECADLLYFVCVLMHQKGAAWQDILDELDRRHKK